MFCQATILVLVHLAELKPVLKDLVHKFSYVDFTYPWLQHPNCRDTTLAHTDIVHTQPNNARVKVKKRQVKCKGSGTVYNNTAQSHMSKQDNILCPWSIQTALQICKDD